MGSAQSRRAKYVLQHGSLPLYGDITRLVEVLVLSEEERPQLHRQLADHACTLATALGVADDDPVLRFEYVAQAMMQGFATTLNITFQRGAPTAGELQTAAQLIREQYANADWTASR